MLQRSLYHAEIPPGPLRRRARVALQSLEPTPQGVRRFVSEFPLDLAEVAPVIGFSGSERVRILLARNETAEIYLCAWLPGQASSVHDHQTALYGVRVLTGVLTEDLFESRDGEAARLRDLHYLEPGSIVHHPGPVVHRLRNSGQHFAITLHAHVPARERPQRYVIKREPSEAGTPVTPSSSGA